MIIARITGGLGNQLFQYANARRLAEYHTTDLFLDTREFSKKLYRPFLLDKFNIRAEIASESELKTILKLSNKFSFDHQRFIHKLFPAVYPNVIYEKYFQFDPSYINLPDNIYLIGFWQSEKYFNNISNLLHSELTMNEKISDDGNKLLSRIKQGNSVAVTVRRGDFVTDPYINRRHGVLSLDYYADSVAFLESKIDKPSYFIFSDDPVWTENNIKIKGKVEYVRINYPNRVYENLIIGSFAKHQILANSTFSWWMAWLKDSGKRLVIAPKKWFSGLNLDTSDLIPERWFRI